MTTPWLRSLRGTATKAALVTAVAALAAGCSTFETKRAVLGKTEALRAGPKAVPQQAITNFSPALRCMDSLFIAYGVRDVGVLVEDLTDHTRKLNAGSKDMLISAISQMTVRSKAVKLVVYGPDSGNLIGLLRESQRRDPYATLPEFDIKGSISQLDEGLARKQADGGFSFWDRLSIGASKTASTSVLAVDLSMVSTADLSLVPGVTSRNSVVIVKSGSGADSEAQIRKFGVNFNLSIAQSEGQAQALRTLLELAAVELVGKLTRVPYWTCLGSSADDAAVKREISDWFAGMLGDRAELVRWFQNQLRVRGLYKGAVDGVPTPPLAEAIAAYRARLGLQKNARVDLAFFTAYLAAKHPAPVATSAPRVTPRTAAGPAAPA
jgi:peptidoglycan hydrolase-like protein with peptidoglycan-binding domain